MSLPHMTLGIVPGNQCQSAFTVGRVPLGTKPAAQVETPDGKGNGQRGAAHTADSRGAGKLGRSSAALLTKADTGTWPPVAALTLTSRSRVAFCLPPIRRYSVMREQLASRAMSCIDLPEALAYSNRGCFCSMPACNV